MSLSEHCGELSFHLLDAVAGDAFFIVFPSSCLGLGGFLDKPKFLSQFLHEVPFPGFGIKVYHMPCAGGYLLGRCVCVCHGEGGGACSRAGSSDFSQSDDLNPQRRPP